MFGIFYYLAINSLPEHQLKFSWGKNEAQFNKLTISQNIIKDDSGFELKTLIISSPRCSNKFQKLLSPYKSNNKNIILFWGYSRESGKLEKDFSDKYSLDKLMYIEGGNLKSYLFNLEEAGEYIFKHVFEKELNGEFYYLVEFYKEEGFSNFEILRFWLKFDKNISIENLIVSILGKNCNTFNQFVHYKEDNGVAGLLTIDANYLNAIDSSTGNTYTIFGIEDNTPENNTFSNLRIKYFDVKKRINIVNFKVRKNCSESLEKLKEQIQQNLNIERNKFRFINDNQVTQFMSLEEDGQRFHQKTKKKHSTTLLHSTELVQK
jgi:hypothetical protein